VTDSKSPSSERSSLAVEELRSLILHHFSVTAATHVVIFTSGATAACQMVAEHFPFTEDSFFWHPIQCHTSLLGMRAVAMRRGAQDVVGEADYGRGDYAHPSEQDASNDPSPCPTTPHHLLAVPAECNFDGTRLYPLREQLQKLRNRELPSLKALREGGGKAWLLLDAACFLRTAPLDLSKIPVDFLTFSFYKLFGYPTGLGALVARKEALEILDPTLGFGYFGGGSVRSYLATSPWEIRHAPTNPACWEHGSIDWLGIIAASVGFKSYWRSSIWEKDVSLAHRLTVECAKRMLSMRHGNNSPMFVLYGHWGEWLGEDDDSPLSEPILTQRQGCTIAFNCLRSDGSLIGNVEMARLFALLHVNIRSGCFCNAGACMLALGLEAADIVAAHKAGHSCGDNMDFVEGKPTGALRLSWGRGNTLSDLEHLCQLWAQYWQEDANGNTAEMLRLCRLGAIALPRSPLSAAAAVAKDRNARIGRSRRCRIESLHLYPIKGLGGISLRQSHFALDRHWAIARSNGRLAGPRSLRRLLLVSVRCEEEQRACVLEAAEFGHCRLSWPRHGSEASEQEMQAMQAELTSVSTWLSRVLQEPVTLQAATASQPRFTNHTASDKSLLLVSRQSLRALALCTHLLEADLIARLRVNVVVNAKEEEEEEEEEEASAASAADPHWEDAMITWQPVPAVAVTTDRDRDREGGKPWWSRIQPCVRCHSINVDPVTGVMGNEPLKTLCSYRQSANRNGQVCFGVLVQQHGVEEEVCVGTDWMGMDTQL
jgi:molybdenum cofactor sulfurtransferase